MKCLVFRPAIRSTSAHWHTLRAWHCCNRIWNCHKLPKRGGDDDGETHRLMSHHLFKYFFFGRELFACCCFCCRVFSLCGFVNPNLDHTCHNASNTPLHTRAHTHTHTNRAHTHTHRHRHKKKKINKFYCRRRFRWCCFECVCATFELSVLSRGKTTTTTTWMFSDLFLGWRTRNNNRQYTYTQTHRTPHTAPRKWKKKQKTKQKFWIQFFKRRWERDEMTTGPARARTNGPKSGDRLV